MKTSLTKRSLALALLLACAPVALLSGSQAHAATFAAVPFTDIIKDAPIIVHGTIIGDSSGQILDGMPYTYYQLTVTNVMKGTLTVNPVAIRQPGGLNLRMSGTAGFTAGEDVILLLNGPNTDGSYNVHGLAMGKIKVAPDGDLSGTAIEADRQANEHAAAIALEKSAQDHTPAPAALAHSKHWKLDDLQGFLSEAEGWEVQP